MLLPFNDLLKRYKLAPRDIWHVGAHHAEERMLYADISPRPSRVFWIEGDSQACDAIRDLIKRQGPRFGEERVERAYLWSKAGERHRLYEASNGQSSSILSPHIHLDEHPEVTFKAELIVETEVLEYFIMRYGSPTRGLLVIDVQGAELMVLQGTGDYLRMFDAVYLEVNYREMYHKCSMLFEVDNFMASQGFLRMDTQMTSHGWGDALYVSARVLNA